MNTKYKYYYFYDVGKISSYLGLIVFAFGLMINFFTGQNIFWLAGLLLTYFGFISLLVVQHYRDKYEEEKLNSQE